uniref:Putative DUF21 domain-containing protein n=1 Tax=Tanacetum cinerariifolium TaxID=118510 RepID=A0A699JBQ2_TANCI|nr:putative DUF21 domain-containing protein [Tanacetum cinerariifolium]GFA25653.1 putative DUF21 domain-containing protein [Tanacetum cinerariifolium]
MYSNNLVSINGQKADKGGELTHDEATIINETLDLTEKVLGDMNIHGQMAGKRGELTHDERTIINEALDLTKKVLGYMNIRS